MSFLATHIHELKKKKHHKVVSNYKYLYMTAILENMKLTLFAFFLLLNFFLSFLFIHIFQKIKLDLETMSTTQLTESIQQTIPAVWGVGGRK